MFRGSNQRRELPFAIKLRGRSPTLCHSCQRGREFGIMMIGGACVFPSMTKGDIVERLVVVIDVNHIHWFWTAIFMKVFGHEGQCK
jgi:hypothetical protein